MPSGRAAHQRSLCSWNMAPTPLCPTATSNLLSITLHWYAAVALQCLPCIGLASDSLPWLQVDVDIVHGLLKAGAQLFASDATEATALHWAAEVGAGAVLTALLEAGAKTEARDIFGHMALAYALDCGAEEVVSPLLYSAASDMDSILSLHLDSACALDKGDSDDETYASDTDFDAADTEDSAGHLDTGPSFAFGESCHGWASRAMPMTLPPLNFAPFGLSDLSTSPSSSFAAFAPVAPGSPAAASSGFFPPLGCSLSMAAF